MAITTTNPFQLPKLFADLSRQFPSLDYYDADIPLSLRFIAHTDTHLLGRCHISFDEEWVQAIEPLTSPWEKDELSESITDVLALTEHLKSKLQTGHIPLDELIVRQKLSRELDAYKTPSPAARAALQLHTEGRETPAGGSVRFLYTRGDMGVHAWELENKPDARSLDTKRYCHPLDRAIQTVLDPCKPQSSMYQLL